MYLNILQESFLLLCFFNLYSFFRGFDIASLGKNQIIGIKRKKNNYFGACFKKILCNFLNIKSSITLIHFNFKLNFLESNIRMEMKLVKGVILFII